MVTTELATLSLVCCSFFFKQKTAYEAGGCLAFRRVRLFHPHQQRWSAHFAWSPDGTRLLGRTATGRATISLLRMNNELIMALRQLWVTLRLHPRDTGL